MKKALSILLALVMLFSLFACGQQSSDPAAPGANDDGKKEDVKQDSNAPAADEPKEISIAVTTDYGSLDTLAMPSTGFDQILCVQEPLFEIVTATGEIRPVLAESWEWPEDDHMVVHLKKGIKFSNGNDFTADDVMFTLTLNRDSGNAYGPPNVQTTDFERTKVIDDYTLDWYLKSPSVLHYSVGSGMMIYDAESYDPDVQATRPIGTGPYVVTDYVINSHCVVERRDDYWGELPEIEKITFRVLAEPSQRVNAIETGLVDVAPVQLADVEYIKGIDGLDVRARAGSWIYMGFNFSADGQLSDPEARYAICHAIGTQAISNIVYYGLARPMVGPFTPAIVDHEARQDGLGVYAEGYNLELAKELAEKSGLVGKTLTLVNNGSSEHVAVSEMVQNMLSQIGVNVSIVSYDNASFASVKNDKTLYDISISNGTCVNMMSGDSFNNPIIHNDIFNVKEDWAYGHGPRYFEIMSQSLSVLDDAKRSDVVQELMELYVETGPTFGLVEFDAFIAYNTKLDMSDYVDRVVRSYFARDFKFAD